MAADTEPLEILLHLPLLAEDKVNSLTNVTYFLKYVRLIVFLFPLLLLSSAVFFFYFFMGDV